MHIFKKLGCATILPIFALLLGYFAFLILCGYIFVVIEEDDDEQTKTSRRLAFLRTLDKYNISYNNSMIQEIVAAAANVFDVNGLDLNDYTKHIHSEWDIGSSVFFAGTIVTTIGYGNIVPQTTWGKAFCVILAIIGIPFTGVVLGKIGVAFSDLIKKADAFIENRIKQCFPKASADEKMKGYVQKIQLTFVLSLFIILFLLIPAGIFIEFETEWSYFDSFYFCFISLTTIGLGDLTPGGSLKAIKIRDGVNADTVKKSLRQGTVMLYLLFGLAALSIFLTMIGSILQSAAEKTLQGGTSLMNKGGQAFKDVGAFELVNETKRFASSIRKKTVNTLGFSNSEQSVTDDSQMGAKNDAATDVEGNTIKNAFAEEEDGKEHAEGIVIVTENANGYSPIEAEGEEGMTQSNAIINDDGIGNEEGKAVENEEKDSVVVAFTNEAAKMPMADACES